MQQNYATVTVIFWDTVNGQMAKQGYMNCEFPTDSIDVDVNKFNLPSWYELDGSQETVHIDYNGYSTTATVNVKPAAVEEDVTVDVTVNFYDTEAKAMVLDETGKEVTITKQYTFKAGSEDEAEMLIDPADLPEGYEEDGDASVTVYRDYPNFRTVNVKKIKKTRTVNVTFTVDPEMGTLTDYAPSTVVTFENLDEFSDQQFEIPAVEAKEGYKFVGWKGQGAEEINWSADAKTFGVTGLAFFEEGSNVGNASVEAVFEEVEKETESETETETTTETETETDKKTVVTEKNNKSDDNSKKTSDSAVKTGDTTTVMPYVIALFAAAALIVVLALKKRRTF